MHKSRPADMIEMPVRQADRGKLKAVGLNEFNNLRRSLARVDADGLTHIFTRNNSGVLLESG